MWTCATIKNHLMLRLSLDHQYPRLNLVRKQAEDGARYFGPFDKAGAARKTLYLLQRIFPLAPLHGPTPLTTASVPVWIMRRGRCTAPCTGQISQPEYMRLARQMEAFFRGQGLRMWPKSWSGSCWRPPGKSAMRPPPCTGTGSWPYAATLERQRVGPDRRGRSGCAGPGG